MPPQDAAKVKIILPGDVMSDSLIDRINRAYREHHAQFSRDIEDATWQFFLEQATPIVPDALPPPPPEQLRRIGARLHRAVLCLASSDDEYDIKDYHIAPEILEFPEYFGKPPVAVTYYDFYVEEFAEPVDTVFEMDYTDEEISMEELLEEGWRRFDIDQFHQQKLQELNEFKESGGWIDGSR